MKKMSVKGILLLVAVTAGLCLGTAAAGMAAPKYDWKVGHVLAPDHPWSIALQKFGEELAGRSNGRIQLTIFPSGKLGQEREAIESLQMGTLDFTIISSGSLANFTKSQNILDMHYLIPSVKAGRAVVDSPIGRRLLDGLDEIGIKGIDYWENGMYTIYGNKRVQHPADVRGLKIRVNDNQFHIETYEILQATPVHIPWGDIYTSLEQGTCDMSTTTLVNLHSAKHDEASQYIVKANQLYTVSPLLMSKQIWDEAPADIRDIITQSSQIAMAYERRLLEEANVKAEAEIKAMGKEIIEVDAAEWRAAIQPVYDAHIGKDLDQGLYDAITAIVKANTD
ncbi:MAG: TRAP transporter substrate-binding protein [Desulfarculales bacterium]|jgi:tripartite ATP-independent transporter DctP family solute receptor|nr:TRAP transporter substrate-binding protein [Desulfarculales bacterium]